VLLFGGVQFIGTEAIESFILARVEMTAIGFCLFVKKKKPKQQQRYVDANLYFSSLT